MAKLKDLTGQKFGRLKVEKFSHSKKTSYKRNRNYWKCKCNCGNITYVESGDLMRKKHPTISCGCYRKEIQKEIGKKYSKNKSPIWKGYGEISGAYICNIKSHAKSRKLKYNLTKKFLWELFLKQERKCAISNIFLYFKGFNSEETTASLDRIDSSKGYIKENVQWVHKDINNMKQHFSMEYFLKLCKIITECYNA